QGTRPTPPNALAAGVGPSPVEGPWLPEPQEPLVREKQKGQASRQPEACPFRGSGLPRLLLQRRLGGRQAGDRHPEGAATHVIQADLVAELDRVGVAAVLPADANLQLLARRPAPFHAQFHQAAHTVHVNRLEWVTCYDLWQQHLVAPLVLHLRRVDVAADETSVVAPPPTPCPLRPHAVVRN